MSGKYKNRTKLLGIPVPGYGDAIWPELELQKYQLIENMLMAGLRGAVNSVFDEGDMAVRQVENGTYRVTLSATGNHSSAEGTVGGAYFKAPTSVVWEGLKDGTTYFLYLKGSPKTFADQQDVRPVSSPRRLLDKVSVLVAKVELNGDSSVVDRSPDGKMHARDFENHVMDWDNPHGMKVSQDELMVSKVLHLGKDAVIEVGPDDATVRIPASVLAAVTRTSRKVIDFVTGGSLGTMLEGGGVVSFVAVSRICLGPLNVGVDEVGEIAIGYHGSDMSVSRPDQFVVRNSGAVGIPMKALVICG